ncbi:aspartate dehydrogenase domain-containing protein [Microbacterium soli]|uniref:Aspartate dehydrogenase n=1 Tax=Microbacterium soli TaxID=446075 RepID=A0ABP7N5C9_9MICO
MTDLRVGFLGGGHINGSLRRAVEDSRPYRVVGTFGRDAELPDAGTVDVIVEAATQQAVRERVPALLERGIDVILLSIGALADAELRTTLGRRMPGRGRIIACTGAIGGLDQVRALRASGPLSEISLESRKSPAALIQPWMADSLQAALRAGQTEIVLAEGPAGDVAQRFPASANVVAALALAADAWDIATARVVADPGAVRTRHEVRAAGALGEVRAVVTNAPSSERPRSSAVVAWAALRALDDWARLRGFPDAGGLTFL